MGHVTPMILFCILSRWEKLSRKMFLLIEMLWIRQNMNLKIVEEKPFSLSTIPLSVNFTINQRSHYPQFPYFHTVQYRWVQGNFLLFKLTPLLARFYKFYRVNYPYTHVDIFLYFCGCHN